MADAVVKKGGHLTSATNIKKFCKEEVKRLRPAWGATQVAESVTNGAEAHLKAWLRARIEQHPTLGKTLT